MRSLTSASREAREPRASAEKMDWRITTAIAASEPIVQSYQVCRPPSMAAVAAATTTTSGSASSIRCERRCRALVEPTGLPAAQAA